MKLTDLKIWAFNRSRGSMKNGKIITGGPKLHTPTGDARKKYGAVG